jgi:hypothetical protein
MARDKDSKKKEEKVLTDYEKVYKNFMDDYNDMELQNRYEGMVKSADRMKERINKEITEHNQNVETEQELQDLIFKSVLVGIMPTEAIEQFKDLNAKNVKRLTEIQGLQMKNLEEYALIEKYKSWTEKKLFQYWSILKDLNEVIPAWFEWKKDFDNRIF